MEATILMIYWESTDQTLCTLHCYLSFTCETKQTFAPFVYRHGGGATRTLLLVTGMQRQI